MPLKRNQTPGFTRRVVAYTTDEEYEAIRYEAAQDEATVSHWMRGLAMSAIAQRQARRGGWEA